jgi:hypothetical protein
MGTAIAPHQCTLPLHPILKMRIGYDIATAVVTGMMVGNEFAVAAFIHPQIKKLDDNVHARIAAPLASILGKVMPPWYGLSLALILGAAFASAPDEWPRVVSPVGRHTLGGDHHLYHHYARTAEQPHREDGSQSAL